MVQLKQVQLRLKSIKNIQKITKTMKMVSASKFTRAEKELKAARPFGFGPRKFYESSKLQVEHVVADPRDPDAKPDAPPPAEDKERKKVFVAVTSDRGLCGGVHSGISRRIKRDLETRGGDAALSKLVCIGDKSRSVLRRTFTPNMLISCKDLGRVAPVFSDASKIASAIADAGYKYDEGDIYYNKYYSPVKYVMTVVPFYSKPDIENAPNITAFDDVEDAESYAEFTVAALLYYALKESAASEQSARMAAMDNATKNADDMIRKLTLLFNRTRQAVITRELIEIISGAAALKN